MTLLSDIQSHRAEILAIAAECGLKDIRIFGSVARGEEGPESDIDFLVNYDAASKKGWEAFGFPGAMEDMFHRKIDMVFETGLHRVIRDSVLQEAKAL